MLHLYRTRVGANLRQTLAAALAGLGLSHTIGMAMLSGLVRSDRPFFRTPKRSQRHALGEAFAASREEALLMGGLWLCAYAVSRIPSLDGDLPGFVGGPDLTVWVSVLMIQSLPYAATVLVSLISALDLPGLWIGEAGAPGPATPASGAGSADRQRLLPLRLLLRRRDQRLLGRAGRADEEALLEQRPFRALAEPGHHHRDSREPEQPELRAAAMRFGGERADPAATLSCRGSGRS